MVWEDKLVCVSSAGGNLVLKEKEKRQDVKQEENKQVLLKSPHSSPNRERRKWKIMQPCYPRENMFRKLRLQMFDLKRCQMFNSFIKFGKRLSMLLCHT